MTREQKLEKALTNLLNMYLEGANSGDWGNWNPEEDAEVIEAREALAQQPDAGVELTDGEIVAASGYKGLTKTEVGICRRAIAAHEAKKRGAA